MDIYTKCYFKLNRCTDGDCSNGLVCDGYLNFCRIKSNNTDDTFCDGILCKEGEGGCSSDSQCEGFLTCGTSNCPNGLTDMDCCSGKEKNFRYSKIELVHHMKLMGLNAQNCSVIFYPRVARIQERKFVSCRVIVAILRDNARDSYR